MKPDDIPQDVWDDAMHLHGELGYDEVCLNGGSAAEIVEACNADAELIARAIMAAKIEAKVEEMNACISIVQEVGIEWGALEASQACEKAVLLMIGKPN